MHTDNVTQQMMRLSHTGRWEIVEAQSDLDDVAALFEPCGLQYHTMAMLPVVGAIETAAYAAALTRGVDFAQEWELRYELVFEDSPCPLSPVNYHIPSLQGNVYVLAVLVRERTGERRDMDIDVHMADTVIDTLYRWRGRAI